MEHIPIVTASTSAPLVDMASDHEITSLIGKIREVFETHFDRSWLAAVIDELPIDTRTVREIRDFVSIRSLAPDETHRVESGLEELHRYIWTLKTHLVPNVKELLGVSPFSPGRGRMDKSQLILRRFTAHALPHNLEHLTSLVDALGKRWRSRYTSGNSSRIAAIESSSIPLRSGSV